MMMMMILLWLTFIDKQRSENIDLVEVKLLLYILDNLTITDPIDVLNSGFCMFCGYSNWTEKLSNGTLEQY